MHVVISLLRFGQNGSTGSGLRTGSYDPSASVPRLEKVNSFITEAGTTDGTCGSNVPPTSVLHQVGLGRNTRGGNGAS